MDDRQLVLTLTRDESRVVRELLALLGNVVSPLIIGTYLDSTGLHPSAGESLAAKLEEFISATGPERN